MIIAKPHQFRINWVCVQTAFNYAIAFAAVFAAGGWLVSIRVQEASKPYQDRQAMAYEQVQKVAGPNPVASIKCERKRADTAVRVADQAVEVSNFAAVPDKLLQAIPACPPPPKATAK